MNSYKTYLRFLFILLTFISGSLNVFAQGGNEHEIQFEQMVNNDENFQSTINSIYQDQKGYMWFAAWTGLYKYDGLKLKVYKPDNTNPRSIGTRKIRKIFEDSKGNLWIGTMNEGLYKFNREKEEFVQFRHDRTNPESIGNNDITEIYEDHQGRVWIGTVDGLNLLIETYEKGKDGIRHLKIVFKKFNIEKHFHGFPGDRINAVLEDKKGRLWVGTETGLFNFNPKNRNPFRRIILPQTSNTIEQDNYTYCLLETTGEVKGNKETIIWIGTRAGLKKMVINNTEHDPLASPYFVSYHPQINERGAISNNRVRALFKSKFDKDFIWAGTEDGLNRLDIRTGTFQVYKTNYKDLHSISNNVIYSFYEDRSGILWIGTEKGVNKYDRFRKKFKLYQASSGLSHNYITSLASGNPNTVWVGTSGGGLNKIILDTQSGYPKDIFECELPESQFDKFSNYIYTLIVDKQGRVWLGTNGGGIYRFSESDVKNQNQEIRNYVNFQGRIEDDKGGLNDVYIMSLYEDSRGDIWIGTWNGGFCKFDSKKNDFVRYNHFKQIPSNIWKIPVTAFYEDHEGIIWIGTRGGGVYRLKEGQNLDFTIYKNDRDNTFSLSNNFINFIYEDKKNNVWFGTEGGLNLFDRKTEHFQSYTEHNGLPSDIMQSMLEDDQGNLWISTNHGISKLTPDILFTSNPSSAFRNYNKEDGLQADIFNNNAGTKTARGLMLFGGINGLNCFFPDRIINNLNPPQVEITNFLIWNKPVPIGPNKEGRVILSKAINETEEVELNYKDNSISFEFSSLHYASPGKNMYEYRMLGFDENWIVTDATRNLAHYTNLDPGEYTLEVKASNNDGIWSVETAKLHIIIRPPFWKTPWAYTFYVLMFFGLLYILRSIILMRANFRHNLNLERVKRENAEAMNQIKLRFFTNISHEIRTPLTLILGSLDRVLNLNEVNARVQNQLLVMQKNGHLMLKLISELLDFRKMEAGHLGLKAAKGNIINFINGIFISFKDLAFDKKINYSLEKQYEVMEVWYDRDKLEKVIYNLLSNAFKFTPNGGTITIKVEIEPFTQMVEKFSNKEKSMVKSDFLKITVTDTGVGIPQNQLDKIFELYYQADTNDTFLANTGTGIGLSLSKSLIDLHKGFLTVESQEAKGSQFFLFLPLGKDHLQESEIIHDFKDSEHKNHYLINQLEVKTVMREEKKADVDEDLLDAPLLLIVEDNNDVRAFIKQCFEDNYRILVAANGEEALTIALERIPDLIISDVVMPRMDGIEFCRMIKTNEKTSHIPLILLTSRTSLVYKTEGLETGADDYITKPFNAQILSLKVKNLIKLKKSLGEKFSSKKYLAPKDIVINSLDELFLNKAIEVVNDKMSNSEFSIEDFGREMAMSRMQLYRKLKALTGLSPNEFIRNQRIQRAGQLLEKSELTIAEITYEVGFTDLKYFRKCFKEYYNVNPSEYAKNSDTTIGQSDERLE